MHIGANDNQLPTPPTSAEFRDGLKTLADQLFAL